MSTWIALKVRTGNERMVAYDLEQNLKRSTMAQLVEEVFPAVRSIFTNSTGNIRFEAMLPGYILVKTRKLTNHLWHLLYNTPGVYYILNGWVTDDEVARLRPYCTHEVEIGIPANANNQTNLIQKFKDFIRNKRNNRQVLCFPLQIARELYNKAVRLFREPVSDRKFLAMLETVELAI